MIQKITKTLFIFISSILPIISQSQNWNWSEKLGGINADYIGDMTTDISGNIYICGWFEGTITIGSTSITSTGNYDAYIAKYNGTGDLVWVNQSGGESADAAKGIGIDTFGNVYVTGYFEGNANFGTNTIASSGARDIFICKYDSSGNLSWVKDLGGSQIDEGNSIVINSAANPIITGIFNGTASFDTISLTSNGQDDIFVASFLNDGTFNWVVQAGGSQNENSTSISSDNLNNVYICGYFNDTLLINQDTILSKGLTDALVLKFDADGNFIWVKNFGAGNYDYATGLIVSNGYFYLTGYFNSTFIIESDTIWSWGQTDFYVAQFDTAGTYQWIRKAGGEDFDYSYDITCDKQGFIYLTGAIKDSVVTFSNGQELQSNGGYDVFMAKYTPEGNIVWVQQAGGSYYEYGYCLAIDTSGTIYLGGTFENSLIIGNDSLTCDGLTDVYLTSYTNTISNINDNTKHGIIKIFPNPSNGNYYIANLESQTDVTIDLYTTTGQLAFNKVIKASKGFFYNIDITDLPKGIYLIHAYNNTLNYYSKLVYD